MEKGGASFFYHADGLGSITEITDSTGDIKQRYTYSSFGKIESQLDPTFIQPYRFTAREFDPETGLYHYRERQYDWKTGRFTGQDDLRFASLKLPASLNLYSYVLNNPIRYIDPNGHKPVNVCPLPLPAGFDRFSDCFGSCAADALRENLETLGRNLQRSVLTGTALGVGACAVITIGEPYLLPLFPACAGVAAASTTGVLATASVANFNIGTVASLAGCGVGCLGK